MFGADPFFVGLDVGLDVARAAKVAIGVVVSIVDSESELGTDVGFG